MRGGAPARTMATGVPFARVAHQILRGLLGAFPAGLAAALASMLSESSRTMASAIEAPLWRPRASARTAHERCRAEQRERDHRRGANRVERAIVDPAATP